MYESFYKLHKTPFRLTPDPYFFFGSRTHKRGAAYLRYAMQQGEGFVVITGGPGTGKTELMFNLIRELDDPRTVFAKIVSTNLKADDLLELVAASFELYAEGLGKGILLKKLENFFIACTRQGKQVFLLIDEAHNLSTASLAELSMLSNFQLGEKAMLRCFLLGQEALEKKLEEPELAHLKQRVIASAHLNPMDEDETTEYIKHRLAQAGWKGNNPRFHDNAYSLIHKFTGGIPRQINFFCNRLLLQGYIDELHKIDVGVVYGVIKELLEETTVAHAPCNLDEALDETFSAALSGANTSVHRYQRPWLPKTDARELRMPTPLLRVVTNQAFTPKKPESTSLATDNKSISTVLIARHASQEGTNILQELTRDGARRLLRTLTQDSQADRELRASVAFYIRAESARLISPDSIRQLNADIPARPFPARTDHHLSFTWKWIAVASVAVLGVFISPQLQHVDKLVTLSGTTGSKETNRLMVATIAPVLTQDATDDEENIIGNRQLATIMPAGKNDTSTSGPATAIDSLQSDNSQPTPETSPSGIITEISPSTTGVTKQLAGKQDGVPEANEALNQQKKTERVPIIVTLASSDQAPALPLAPKSSPKPSKTRLPAENPKPARASKVTNTPAIVFPLPSLPSLTLAKSAENQPRPATPLAKHEQPPVIDNPVEPTTATETETGILKADLKILLSRLTSAYEAGNLRKLVSVFAENARSNDKISLDEIEDDYRKLFDVTDMRKMMINDVQWKTFKNRMRGKGNFQLVVREKGAGRVVSYDGSIRFDVAQGTRGIVITQLDYHYDK